MYRKMFASICFSIGLLIPGKMLGQGKIGAEDLEKFHIMEDSMLLNIDSMYTAIIPDTRLFYCEKFVHQLVRTLKIPNSYYYAFGKIEKKISIMYPDDKSFRIFNWQIVPTDVTRRYYGAIQMEGEELKLYPLVDYTTELGKTAADSVLTNGKWFGALYYRIITHEVSGKPVYTLFGLNASNPISNKKVMDPMSITPDGPVFGAAIFNMTGDKDLKFGSIYRFIMEYKKEVQASMNWDDDLKTVFFDKLVSQANDPNRKYTFVPSGEYDGFKWDNEQWNYITNLIPIQNLKDGEAPSGTTPSR